MKRAHRSAHRLIWLILAPALLTAIALSAATKAILPTESEAPDVISQRTR